MTRNIFLLVLTFQITMCAAGAPEPELVVRSIQGFPAAGGIF